MAHPWNKGNLNEVYPSLQIDLCLRGSQRAPLKAEDQVRDLNREVIPSILSVNMQHSAKTSWLVSAADTPKNASPAKMKLAAMMEQLLEGEREAADAIDQACTAMKEAKTAEKEARAVVRQVKGLALEARQEALATAERAREEKQEAIATKEQALEIGEKFRYVN